MRKSIDQVRETQSLTSWFFLSDPENFGRSGHDFPPVILVMDSYGPRERDCVFLQ